MHRAPLIAVLAVASNLIACEADQVAQIDPCLEATPDHIDFGTVELGQEASSAINLKSCSAVKTAIASVEIVDDCGGCFLAIDPPGEITNFNEIEFSARFRATRLEAATGTVTITSNAPKTPTRMITLIGRGSDLRKPDVAVSPPSVDFGFVPAGGIAVSSFVVRSTGTNTLFVDRISIDPVTAPFRITTSTPTPEHHGELVPGAQASVALRAELLESFTGTASARVLIETNVLEEKNVPGRPGVVAIPLTAQSNLAPLAIVTGPATVEPYSRVTVDGSMSHDRDNPPNNPLVFRWTLVSKPGGSQAALERTSTALPSFFADLTGRYEVRLVVTDALGLESEPASLVVEALPTNAIRIELTWDHPDSDLDLHLLKQDGAFCDCDTDCHFRDCGRRPNWYPTAPGANPRLDIDDRSGFGPENINIDGDGANRFIQPGTYKIAVHYYSSNSGVSSWPTNVSNATVRVYIYGLLAAELTHAMQNDGEVWFAGVIHWPEQTVVPDGGVQPRAVCGAF